MLELDDIIEEYLQLEKQRESFKDGDDHMSSVGYLAINNTMNFIYTKFELTKELIENYKESKYNSDVTVKPICTNINPPKLKDNY